MSIEHTPPGECGAVIPDEGAYPHLGAVCNEPAGHDGDHVASYERRPGVWETITWWPNEAPAEACGAPVVTYRGEIFVCDKPPGHDGLHACSTFSP